jgi:hypothetical protein
MRQERSLLEPWNARMRRTFSVLNLERGDTEILSAASVRAHQVPSFFSTLLRLLPSVFIAPLTAALGLLVFLLS